MPYTSALLPAVTGIKDLSVFTSNLYYFGYFSFSPDFFECSFSVSNHLAASD